MRNWNNYGNENRMIGQILSLDEWNNMIEFWYTTRNNLFHGAKHPENERDQFIVEYGYKTLSKYMSRVLL